MPRPRPIPWLLALPLAALLLSGTAEAQCVDADGDGFGTGVGCVGPDLDDAASSCTDDASDDDGDGAIDCLDRCLDVDGDEYGVDLAGTIVGSGSIAVGDCTTDGVTPCSLQDAACQGPDLDDAASTCSLDASDTDGDTAIDCLDLCLDADGDDYGVDQSALLGGCVADGASGGSTPCAFLDGACIAEDCDDSNPSLNVSCAEPLPMPGATLPGALAIGAAIAATALLHARSRTAT